MTNRLMRLLFILVIILLVAGPAKAGATFGDYTGPEWLEPSLPGYRFTVDVISLTTPHDQICLVYDVGGVPQDSEACSCTAPDCGVDGVGIWVCDIPANHPDTIITWDLSAYPGNSCTGTSVSGPNGSFSTGPTAITLASNSAIVNPGISFTVGGIVGILTILLAGLIWLIWRQKLVVRVR